MGTPTRHTRSQCLCQQTWFYALLWSSFLFCLFCTGRGSTTKISYTDHCAAIVPEATPTVRASSGFPQLEPAASYYRGGDKILGEIKSSSHHDFNDSGPYVSFSPTGRVFETDIKGIYKVHANLIFQLPGAYLSYGNYSVYGQNYHPRRVPRPGSLRFFLHGFWSGNSGKLCMVGTASLPSGERKSLNLEAVFVYDHANKNPTLFTSMAKGTLKSLSSSNSRAYFEPIEIVSFPLLDDYIYTLDSKGVHGGCLGGADIPPISLQPESVCSMFLWQSYEFDLEYVTGCKGTRSCGPLEDLPHFSLYGFQCLKDGEKLRYLVSFQSIRYHWRHQSFDPNRTFIGEGSWDSKKNQLCIVVCSILNPFKSLKDVHVGDCSTRLSLRFPAVWTIKDSSSIVGLVWTNKTSTDPGYFKPIKFSSPNSNSNGVGLPGLRYEYTETDKVRELCTKKEAVHKSGDKYPGVSSYDMSFDFNVQHSKVKIASGYAVPISVGDELYRVGSEVISVDAVYGEEADATSSSGQMNVSYKLTFHANGFRNQFFHANSSLNYGGQLEISAEGVYDTTTGRLCMVGCRGLHPQNTSAKSLDCEMLIELQFPPLNSRVGSSIKGYIQSRRAETDPLYFKLLNISSFSLYRVQAQQSIWRMDLEIVLVLISNTLLCIFFASQIFHVKKRPEVLPLISLAMLIVLSVGHMIPLLLNVEALLLNSHGRQQLVRTGDGWFELNEVSVRLVTLVVFLLLLLLLQLAWTARMENGDDFWGAEKKAIFLTLFLYAAGGLITLLVEWRTSDIGDGILPAESADSPNRRQAGLILDWFLFPQIILNAFQNSRESALSGLFYVGTTVVRLVPHAYDLYRVRYYVHQEFDGSYVYANPNADFYSIAWDVIIPCGCILLAVIIWLQQRFGGRCILPGKIQELGSYAKVPTISTE